MADFGNLPHLPDLQDTDQVAVARGTITGRQEVGTLRSNTVDPVARDAARVALERGEQGVDDADLADRKAEIAGRDVADLTTQFRSHVASNLHLTPEQRAFILSGFNAVSVAGAGPARHITFSRANGASVTIPLPAPGAPVDPGPHVIATGTGYDAGTQVLTLVLSNSTTIQIDLSALITVGEFTGEAIAGLVDRFLGTTDWQSRLSGPALEAAIDAATGGTGWRSDPVTQLTGQQISNLLDGLLGTTWRAGVSLEQATDAAGTLLATLSQFTYDPATNTLNSTFGTSVTRDTGTTEGTIPLLGAGGKLPAGLLPDSGLSATDETARNAAAAAQATADAAQTEASANTTFLSTFAARVRSVVEMVVPAWARAASPPSVQTPVATESVSGTVTLARAEDVGDSETDLSRVPTVSRAIALIVRLLGERVRSIPEAEASHVGRPLVATRASRPWASWTQLGTDGYSDDSVTEEKLDSGVRTKLNATGGAGTDQTARNSAANAASAAATADGKAVAAQNTADAAASAAATADAKAVAAQLEADTVIEAGPHFIHMDTTAFNLSINIRHPVNAYNTATLMTVSPAGQPAVIIAYDHTLLHQDTLAEVSSSALQNIWDQTDAIDDGAGGTNNVQRYPVGSYIPVEIRLITGRGGDTVFIRVVDVLVTEAESAVEDATARSAAANALARANTAFSLADTATTPSEATNIANTRAAARYTDAEKAKVAAIGTGGVAPSVDNARETGTQAYRVWVGTQAQYDAVSSKSATTLYFVDPS